MERLEKCHGKYHNFTKINLEIQINLFNLIKFINQFNKTAKTTLKSNTPITAQLI